MTPSIAQTSHRGGISGASEIGPLFAYAFQKTHPPTNTRRPSRKVQNPLEIECQKAEKESERIQEDREKFENACRLYQEYVEHEFRYLTSGDAAYNRGYWLNEVEKTFGLGRVKGGDTRARANRRKAYLRRLINTLADKHQFRIPQRLEEYFR